MRGLLVVFILLGLSVLPYAANAQEDSFSAHTYYAPERPSNSKLFSAFGILTDYSHGNSGGSLCITLDNKKEECFSTSLDVNFNGKADSCFNAGECKNMPEGFILGKTLVKVTYWYAKSMDGTNMTEVTDQVDSVK